MAEHTTLNQAWGALRVVLREFSFYDIKEIAGRAGIDVTHLALLVQQPSGGASKGQLITKLDAEIGSLDFSTKSRVLSHVAEDVIRLRPDQAHCLEEYLGRLGWQFVDGRLIPIKLFDIAELDELPPAATTDLVKAATRLRDGDLDGALAAACAAVDSATNAVYTEQGVEPSESDGFQARYASALKAKGKIDGVTAELNGLGWEAKDAKKLAKNLHGALNHGAFVMQSLRSKMSDVHGSKEVLRPLVFDSLKWAALMVRMLN